MQLGVIGLGRMGGNMVKRLREGGHEVVGYDVSAESNRDVDSLENWYKDFLVRVLYGLWFQLVLLQTQLSKIKQSSRR